MSVLLGKMPFHIYLGGFTSKRAVLHVKTIFFSYCVFQRMAVHGVNLSCQTHQLQTGGSESFFINDGERDLGNNESVFT